MTIDPEDFHHLLSFAQFCLTVGATTASEACLLGTPTLYLNAVHPVCTGLMQEYGLLRMFKPDDAVESMVQAMDELLRNRNSARHNAARFVEQHVNVAAFIADYVEGFVGSGLPTALPAGTT